MRQPKIKQCNVCHQFFLSRGENMCDSCKQASLYACYVNAHEWTPYRPSNGTEGMIFQSAWCDNCHFDGDAEQGKGCMLLAKTMVYDIDDPEYPKEWVQNEEGEARCTKFKSQAMWENEHRHVQHVPQNQIPLFEVNL